MVTFYPMLHQKMLECETSHKELAAIANISVFSLHLKMIGIKRWKLTEAVNICCFFNTYDAERLFQRSVRIVRSKTL